MPMFSVSLQLIDDVDVFYRSFSNLITRPQLLLLAFERELTVSARYYGPALRAAVDAVAAAPIVIAIDDHHVRARAVAVCPLQFSRVTRACASLQDVHVTLKFIGACGDGRSQQVGAGNSQSNSPFRCWLCSTHVDRCVCVCG
jgi:hypothetical protein